jgi:D-tyrosyl-tRNA(Tyr) deacylase
VRALIQRVTQASVTVDGEVLGKIGPGLVVFVGIAQSDGQSEIEYIVSKTANLRIFTDTEGRFNLSALDVGAQLLVVSQFTLYGDTRRGRRPSFSRAAPPGDAASLFVDTLDAFRETGLTVETGRFQAYMNVSISNDGPVTIMLDSDDRNRPRRG